MAAAQRDGASLRPFLKMTNLFIKDIPKDVALTVLRATL